MDRRDFLTVLAGALPVTSELLAWPASGLAQPARATRESAPGWKAGVAAVDITPAAGLWMAGFAARTEAARGTAMPLHAKALALEDGRGRRGVLVTLDLLGVTGGMAARIADEVHRRHQLPRAGLMLNASHTHCGPVVDEMLSVAYDLTRAQREAIAAYTRDLESRVVKVIGDALTGLTPARLTFGQGGCAFAANRRVQFTPDGPVDHAVPVLHVARAPASTSAAVPPPASPPAPPSPSASPSALVAAPFAAASSAPLAIVFGYACHNTTLQAGFTQFHGDYAGVAQAVLQQRHPGATAMFVSGCGADANPKPRGTIELVEQHGTALADAVDRALPAVTAQRHIDDPLDTAFDIVNLPFAPVPDREGWTARLKDTDVYVRRHARLMLDTIDRDGRLPAVQPDPIQVWAFGRELTLIALGGEVVVDYSDRLKKELINRRPWIAGYSNDVFGYVPSQRVLKEGGYEGGGAMIYYGRPGAFTPDVEPLIVDTVHRLVRAVSSPR